MHDYWSIQREEERTAKHLTSLVCFVGYTTNEWTVSAGSLKSAHVRFRRDFKFALLVWVARET